MMYSFRRRCSDNRIAPLAPCVAVATRRPCPSTHRWPGDSRLSAWRLSSSLGDTTLPHLMSISTGKLSCTAGHRSKRWYGQGPRLDVLAIAVHSNIPHGQGSYVAGDSETYREMKIGGMAPSMRQA